MISPVAREKEAMDDKWQRRRARRRAAGAFGEERVLFEQPPSLKVAFALWLVIGIPSILGLVGMVIVGAAFRLRNGSRSARVLLTTIECVQSAAVLVILLDVSINWENELFLLVSLFLGGRAVAIAATIAMWHPDTSRYLDS
jgi:hypothetical protein